MIEYRIVHRSTSASGNGTTELQEGDDFQKNVLKKINAHVLQIVQSYVMIQLQMVMSLLIMLVMLSQKHVVIEEFVVKQV